MKKGQVAVIGTIVVIALLFIVIGVALRFLGNMEYKEDKYEEVKRNAQQLSGVLMTEGVPENWADLNEDDPEIVKVGIIEDERINMDKLKKFSTRDYLNTKKQLGANYDYLFYFEDVNGVPISFDNLGLTFFGWNPGRVDYANGGNDLTLFVDAILTNAKYIAKEEMFVTFDEESGLPLEQRQAKMIVYSWDEADVEIPSGDGGFSCRYTEGECNFIGSSNPEIEIIELSGPFLTNNQRHAAFSTMDVYGARICCTQRQAFELNYDADCEMDKPTSEKLFFSAESNAHVSAVKSSSQGGYDGFTKNFCINAKRDAPIGDVKTLKNIKCQVRRVDCDSGTTCVFSFTGEISSAEGTPIENAHIGGCPRWTNFPRAGPLYCCGFEFN